MAKVSVQLLHGILKDYALAD